MLMTCFDDFIWQHIDTIYHTEDSRLMDLSDEAKDEAVHIWMHSHRTWFDDIYPVAIGRSVGKIVTDMLFGKKPNNSKLIANLFIAMADDCPDDYGRDEQWWSEALGIHLDEIVNLGNFADDLRDRIYLYLEPAIEDYLWQRAANLVATEKRDRGIYE